MDITANAAAEGQTQKQAANPLMLLHALFGSRAGKAKGCGFSDSSSCSCSSFLTLLNDQMLKFGHDFQGIKAEMQSDEFALLPETLHLLLSGGQLAGVGVDEQGLLTVMKSDSEATGDQANGLETDLFDVLGATGLISFLRQTQSADGMKNGISPEILLSVLQSQSDPQLKDKSAAQAVEAAKIAETAMKMTGNVLPGGKNDATGHEKYPDGGKAIPLGAHEKEAIKITAPGNQKMQNETGISFSSLSKETQKGEGSDIRVTQQPASDSGGLKSAFDPGAKDKIVEKWVQMTSDPRTSKDAIAAPSFTKTVGEATGASRVDQAGMKDQAQKLIDRVKGNQSHSRGDHAEARSDVQAKMKVHKDLAYNEQKIAHVSVPDADSVNAKTKADVRGKTAFLDKFSDATGVSSTSSSSGPLQSKPVAPVSPAAIIDRVATEFRETLAQESGRVRMTLTPPSLGTLEMDVMVRNGKVRVMLFAESRDVQRMLAGNIDTLKNSLTGQGMTIERCDVLMQDRRDGYSPYSGNQGLFEDGSARSGHKQTQEESGRKSAGEKPPVSATSVRPSTDSDSISLFA